MSATTVRHTAPRASASAAVEARLPGRRRPVPGFTAVPSAVVRPVMTRSYPAEAKARAIPRPTPRLAPVIRATGRVGSPAFAAC